MVWNNSVDRYIKDGYSREEAEKKASVDHHQADVGINSTKKDSRIGEQSGSLKDVAYEGRADKSSSSESRREIPTGELVERRSEIRKRGSGGGGREMMQGYDPQTGEKVGDSLRSKPKDSKGSSSPNANAGMSAVSSAIGTKGSAGEKAGAGLSSYGAMAGNPYAFGAGLAMTTIAQGQAAKRKEFNEREQEKALLSQKRLQRQMHSIDKLIEVSKGLTI